MMRRKTFIAQTAAVCLCLGALFLVSCGSDVVEDKAAEAAKGYYDSLVEGRYADYVNGFSNAEGLPPSYVEQLVVNAKQFMAQQKEEHGGIREVRTVSSRTDSVRGRTYVFLLFCYADSTQEEVVVPMVEHNGVWMMK